MRASDTKGRQTGEVTSTHLSHGLLIRGKFNDFQISRNEIFISFYLQNFYKYSSGIEQNLSIENHEEKIRIKICSGRKIVKTTPSKKKVLMISQEKIYILLTLKT